VLASCGLLACTGGDTSTGDGDGDGDVFDPNDPGGSSEDPDNTFEHPDFNNPFDDVGSTAPADYLARIHGCKKIKISTLGRMLTSRGVDIQTGGQFTPADLYQTGDVPMGTARYDSLLRENMSLTTSAAVRAFDIWIASAPIIETAMSDGLVAACDDAGTPVAMFNAAGACTIEGIECITGRQATAAHLEICNRGTQDAVDDTGNFDAAKGRQLAMSTLLAAAHTCE
jgi:hypothetical protein